VSKTVKSSPTSQTTPSPARRAGQVAFVGSGPGDPDLLTMRAVELLRAAEVVITEVPGHAELAASFAPDAEVVDGGFGTDGQPLTHAARTKVVVRHAKSGRRVVRLMAGDPFVLSSGPEEV
jgi:uroporphyrinogen III methyltransferase/synthase